MPLPFPGQSNLHFPPVQPLCPIEKLQGRRIPTLTVRIAKSFASEKKSFVCGNSLQQF
jgi:hypothetical protein